jgi:hypothetical protein
VSLLVVAVKPGSKRPGMTVTAEGIEVRVRAAAREGAANAAVRDALAAALGIPPRDVTLARGAAARRKAFEIAGLDADEAMRRLRAAASAQPGERGASSKPR